MDKNEQTYRVVLITQDDIRVLGEKVCFSDIWNLVSRHTHSSTKGRLTIVDNKDNRLVASISLSGLSKLFLSEIAPLYNTLVNSDQFAPAIQTGD
jgi:hypothetical protein